MSSDRDDALSWDGDDDPTLDAAPAAAPATASSLPKGYHAVGKGSESVRDASQASPVADAPDATVESEPESSGAAKPMGNAALVTTGVLGGAYALYVIGWVIGGLRLQGLAQYLVTDFMFLASFSLAALAPVIWFGTTLLLTRHSKTWVRIAWLFAGVILLVPWPFVMTGTVGQ
ncbi:DNA polymerase III subunit gamma/tau [Microbacterium sp. NPDC076911]|uniref:DNA polymerase III subunit gamma/tau n=1 Tax=Microbacterium sp. NPDC076911 TaxID=3154958 RepID=UPI003427369A